MAEKALVQDRWEYTVQCLITGECMPILYSVVNKRGVVIMENLTDIDSAMYHDNLLDLSEELMPLLQDILSQDEIHLEENILEDIALRMIKSPDSVVNILSKASNLHKKQMKKTAKDTQQQVAKDDSVE